MPLPNHDQAHVDRRKLPEYLLNRNHPDAKGKSAFFCARYRSDWERPRDDLLVHPTGRLPTEKKLDTARGTFWKSREGAHSSAASG
jgi:hypothetical protein